MFKRMIIFGNAVVCVLLVGLFTTAMATDSAKLVDLGNGIYQETKSGLMWQVEKSGKLFTNEKEAGQYAATLNFGGYTDWRLPTLAERWDLLQIFMYKNNSGLEFPRADSKYWTTETDKGTRPLVLGITCMCRGDKEIEYKTEGYVRAVRKPTP